MFPFQLCITPERYGKTRRIMEALSGSLPESRLCNGAPIVGRPFAVWGHLWLGAHIVPTAWREGIPFFFVDNGYYKPANGRVTGYYSVTYRSFSPMLLDSPDLTRLPMSMQEWRAPRDNPDGKILLCVPGLAFGKMFGWDMQSWVKEIVRAVRPYTKREIVIRDKSSSWPLSDDLRRAAVVITHSSKSAVEAVVAGVPCIVEPLNPAAPVCGTALSQIEDPPMPDRAQWWASLMCQQFSLDELRRGQALHWLSQALTQGQRDMVAGLPPYSILLDQSDAPSVAEPRPDIVELTLTPGQRLFVNEIEVDWTEKDRKSRAAGAAGRRRAKSASSPLRGP